MDQAQDLTPYNGGMKLDRNSRRGVLNGAICQREGSRFEPARAACSLRARGASSKHILSLAGGVESDLALQ